MNHSDDDENSNAKYSKTTRNLALKKEKQKAYKKAYREKQKNLKKTVTAQVKKNVENAQVISVFETENTNIINNDLNESLSPLSSMSIDGSSSSDSSYYDCESSCNTSILSESDEDFDSVDRFLPLYQNSTNKYDDYIESFYELVLKHKLSDEGANDFLSLTKSILPSPNNVPKSIKKIHDDILEDRNQYVHSFYYCKSCKQIMQDKLCNICKGDCIYFLVLDVIYQIKSIINRENIKNKLLQTQNYCPSNKEFLSTCLDGSVYQDYLRKNKYDITISLCLNSDGAPLIVSKGMSLWPVLAKIIELPDNISESFENLIFIGLWLDNQKPAYDVFMAKCVEAVSLAINSPELKNIGK